MAWLWWLSVLLVCAAYRPNIFDSDPCLDATPEYQVDDIRFSSKYFSQSRPWMRTDLSPKVFKSVGLEYQWSWLKSLMVLGLHQYTFDDVLNIFDEANCSFLAWGDVVRETVMREQPVRIQGEVGCSLDYLTEECSRRLGEDVCVISDSMLLVGDPTLPMNHSGVYVHPIQVFEAGTRFNLNKMDMAYTVDALSIYDNLSGGVYLVDMTGRGLRDACDRVLSPTVDQKEWDEWATSAKSLRYFEMRARYFSPGTSELRKVVVQHLKGNLSDQEVFVWMCDSLLEGQLEDGMCYVKEMNRSNRKRIIDTKTAIAEEMGGGQLRTTMDTLQVTDHHPHPRNKHAYHVDVSEPKDPHPPHHSIFIDKLPGDPPPSVLVDSMVIPLPTGHLTPEPQLQTDTPSMNSSRYSVSTVFLILPLILLIVHRSSLL